MKRIVMTAMFALTASPVLAAEPLRVPEMDIGAGFAAIALLAGAAALIRERGRRK
ncbi:hypothetical protein [Hyphococcus luteus]|uniref:hypothetical protein n=1 Tax=Hyphococcus luteus TaxID=2058213 RepID=UPI0013FD514F|nr:hypothetical protein [Marinicaulis flavus]